MAFAEKYFIQHKHTVGGTTTTTRIELHEDGFVGSSTELDGRGDFWVHEYEGLDPAKIYEEPVQKSRLEMHFNVSDATDKQILTDIFNGNEGDFRLVKKVNSSIVWTGAVINDMLEYPEGGYPFKGVIIAKDLSVLKGDEYTLATGDETIITTLAGLLNNTGYGLDIHTYTSWKENNQTDTTDDFLNEVQNDVYTFREYARTGDESDEQITVLRALKEICRSYSLVLRQAGGAWRLYHVTALTDPTAVDEYIYDSTGAQTAKNTGVSQVDISVDADRVVRYVLPNSKNKFNKALKSVRLRYDHRTQLSGLAIPDIIELADSSTETLTQNFIGDGTQYINLSFDVYAETDISETTMDGRFRIKIDTYYLQDDGSWSTSTNNYYEVALTQGKPLVGGGNVWRGSFSIRTDDIPNAADGTLELVFAGASGGTDFADTTEYSSISFNIVSPVADEKTLFIDYKLSQSGDFSGRMDYGSIWFGDGPASYSKGALSVGSTLTTEWYRKGEATLINHANLLLREIMDVRRSSSRNLRAELLGEYGAQNVLSYDSNYFFFIGGIQTGKDRWDADLLEITVTTASDTFEKIRKFADDSAVGTAGSSGGGGGIDTSTANNTYLNETANLSDLDSVSTAITNLELEDGSKDLNINSLTTTTLKDASGNYLEADGSGNVTFPGNVTINGTTVSTNVDNLDVDDPLIKLADGNATDSLDIGWIGQRLSNNVGILWDESNDHFATILTTDDGTTSGNVTIASYADFKAGAGEFSGIIDSSLTGFQVVVAGSSQSLSGTVNLTFSSGILDVGQGNIQLDSADGSALVQSLDIGTTGHGFDVSGNVDGANANFAGTALFDISTSEFRIKNGSAIFVADGSTGQIALGAETVDDVGLLLDTPARAVTSNTDYDRLKVASSGAVTVVASTTSPIIATAQFDEPNITLASGAAVTNAATVYIESAPTEGDSNYALYAPSGASLVESLDIGATGHGFDSSGNVSGLSGIFSNTFDINIGSGNFSTVGNEISFSRAGANYLSVASGGNLNIGIGTNVKAQITDNRLRFNGTSYSIDIGQGQVSTAGNEIGYNRSGPNYLSVPTSGIMIFHVGSTESYRYTDSLFSVKTNASFSGTGTFSGDLTAQANLIVGDATDGTVDTVQPANYSLTTDFSGKGWQGTDVGDFNIRNLVVRESARFRELIIDQLAVIAGSDLRSVGRGKIKEIDDTAKTVTLDNPRNISASSFVANDFFWIKEIDIDGSSFLDLKGQITAVNVTTVSGEEVIKLTLDTTVTGGTHAGGTTDLSSLTGGEVIVQRGHPTNTDRQALIYTTVSDSDAPVQKYFTGIDSLGAFDAVANISTQVGVLSELTSTYANVTGEGFFSANAYLTDSIRIGDLVTDIDYIEYAGGALTANLSTLEIDSGTFYIDSASNIALGADAANQTLTRASDVGFFTNVSGHFRAGTIDGSGNLSAGFLWDGSNASMKASSIDVTAGTFDLDSAAEHLKVGTVFEVTGGATNTGTVASWDLDSDSLTNNTVGLYASSTQTLHLEGVTINGDVSSSFTGILIDKYNFFGKGGSTVGDVLRVGNASQWLQSRFGAGVDAADDGLRINTTEFTLDGTGNADFSGTLTAPTGSLGALTVSGTLTVGTGGSFTSDVVTFDKTTFNLAAANLSISSANELITLGSSNEVQIGKKLNLSASDDVGLRDDFGAYAGTVDIFGVYMNPENFFAHIHDDDLNQPDGYALRVGGESSNYISVNAASGQGDINFDTYKLAGGSGSAFVGVQTGGGSTKNFFAGATDNTGAGANFYALSSGKLYHPGIGRVLYAGQEVATFGEGGSISGIQDNEWINDVTITNQTSTTGTPESKLRIRFYKRFGEDQLIANFFAADELNISLDDSGDGFSYNCDVIIYVKDSGNNTEITHTVDIGSNAGTSASVSKSYTEFTETIDISTTNTSLVDDTYYYIEVALVAEGANEGTTAPGDSAEVSTYLREDVLLQTATGDNSNV